MSIAAKLGSGFVSAWRASGRVLAKSASAARILWNALRGQDYDS